MFSYHGEAFKNPFLSLLVSLVETHQKAGDMPSSSRSTHRSVSSTVGTHTSKTSPASETGHHEQNSMPRSGWKRLNSGWEGFALLCKSTQQGWLNLKAGMCLSGGRCQEISILPMLETAGSRTECQRIRDHGDTKFPDSLEIIKTVLRLKIHYFGNRRC